MTPKTMPPRSAVPLVIGLLCASVLPASGRAAEPPAQAVESPRSDRAEAATADGLYRIVPGDQLEVKFFYQPELNTQVTVRPDGRLSLQLVDEVEAAGLTIAQLREQLTTAYARELRSPTITVILAGSGARVYVDGEVNRPGALAYVRRMSILQAVSEAGGLKDTASTRQMLVIRPSVPGASPTVLELNYDKALLGDARAMADLHPSDIVFVPRSRIAKVNRWVDQYLRKNVPIPLTLGWYRGF